VRHGHASESGREAAIGRCPFTAGHPDDLIGAILHIPPGAVIVGYVHTHPIDLDEDQRVLSQEDRDFINYLVSHGRADANMLAYITTKDADSSYHHDAYSTYVYDKSNRNKTSPGCDL